MKKKTKVELGVIAGCAVLLGGSTILVNNSKSDDKPLTDSSFVEEISSAAEPETAEVTIYTTAATTAATTPETTAETTAATTPETTPVTTVATTQSTTTAKPNEKTVYVARSGEGTKYHSIPDCSKMTNPREITISEAEALGYTPCQKCY